MPQVPPTLQADPTMQERVDARAYNDAEFAHTIATDTDHTGIMSLEGMLQHVAIHDAEGNTVKEGSYGPYRDAADISIGQNAANNVGERILREEDKAVLSQPEAQPAESPQLGIGKRILRLVRKEVPQTTNEAPTDPIQEQRSEIEKANRQREANTAHIGKHGSYDVEARKSAQEKDLAARQAAEARARLAEAHAKIAA